MQGSLTVIDSRFDGNYVNGVGAGAIAVTTEPGATSAVVHMISVRNSSFTRNGLRDVDDVAGGERSFFGAISSDGPMTIDGCFFGENYSASAASAITRSRWWTSHRRRPPCRPRAGTGRSRSRLRPPSSVGRRDVTGYTVTCGARTQTGPASATPITVTGLSNGSAVSCTVFATNVVGNRPASAPSNTVTPATIPDAPAITSATSGDASATVHFTAPAQTGGAAVIDYTLRCPPGAGSISGSGNLDERVDLPAGSSVTIRLTATVAALPETPVANIASVAAPASVSDPVPTNNIATDGPDLRGLFRDGME